MIQRHSGDGGSSERPDIAATGGNYFVPWLAFGDMTLAEALHSVELFANEVMPAFG